jgi:hypothetical protein
MMTKSTLTKARAEWYDWRERLSENHPGSGLNGEVVFEQMILRSKREKRCAECGGPAEVVQTSGWIKSVDHYFLCDSCDAHFAGSVGGYTYTVLGRTKDGYWGKVESLNNKRIAERLAREFNATTVVRRNG